MFSVRYPHAGNRSGFNEEGSIAPLDAAERGAEAGEDIAASMKRGA